MDGRPLPVPTTVSEPHWSACRRGELTAQRCTSCARYNFPPVARCSYCSSVDLTWVPSSGRGLVDSYTTIYRAQTPAFDVPYTVAIIRLEEGWSMLSNIVDCDPAEVRSGAAVEVTFRAMSDEITLPMFRLA
jgi:uncharacterized protein